MKRLWISVAVLALLHLAPMPVQLSGAAPSEKIDPTLVAYMTGLGSEQLAPVVIWVKDADSASLPEGEVAPSLRAVSDRLAAQGHFMRVIGRRPMLAGVLPIRVVNEAATWSEVDRLYLDMIAEEEMNVARPTIKAKVVNNRGVTGNGAKVAIVDLNGTIPIFDAPIPARTRRRSRASLPARRTARSASRPTCSSGWAVRATGSRPSCSRRSRPPSPGAPA
jgi:hypothetical protein